MEKRFFFIFSSVLWLYLDLLFCISFLPWSKKRRLEARQKPTLKKLSPMVVQPKRTELTLNGYPRSTCKHRISRQTCRLVNARPAEDFHLEIAPATTNKPKLHRHNQYHDYFSSHSFTSSYFFTKNSKSNKHKKSSLNAHAHANAITTIYKTRYFLSQLKFNLETKKQNFSYFLGDENESLLRLNTANTKTNACNWYSLEDKCFLLGKLKRILIKCKCLKILVYSVFFVASYFLNCDVICSFFF